MLSIMIACKCEDIQVGTIDNMLHRMSFDRRVELVRLESLLLSCIGFELYYPSPYTKVYAILVMLQERDVLVVSPKQTDKGHNNQYTNLWYIDDKKVITADLDGIWDRAIENIDYTLCLDRNNWTELEIAYAALDFPNYIFKELPFEYSMDSLEYIKQNVLRVKEFVSLLKK